MRLHSLEMTGFGPFKERQRIDFDRFTDDGLFLIAGRTGAGKSSILDAVYYALYDGAPRYDRGEKRLRSDHCGPDDPTEVTLEFTAGEVRWRVTRSPEYQRPKRRGDGMTSEDARALLEEWDGVQWIGRAAKPRDVAHALEDIVQLSGQQFLQVILLAQNRFARFLLADNNERQTLLRTLFGTRRFSDYVDRFNERRKSAAAAVDSRRTTFSQRISDAETLIRDEHLGPEPVADGGASLVLGDSALDGASALDGSDGEQPIDDEARIAAAIAAVSRAVYRSTTAADEERRLQAAADAAVETHRLLAETSARQEQRAAARVRMDELEADAATISAMRAERDDAARAEELRSAIDAVARADAAEERAGELVAAARDATSDVLGLGHEDGAGSCAEGLSAEGLRREIAERQRTIGELESARVVEQQLPALRETEQQAVIAASTAAMDLATHDERAAALPIERAALDMERDRVGVRGAREPSDSAALAAADARLAAAEAAVGLAAALDDAQRSAIAANEAVSAASTAVATLLRRRLAGAAGSLAEDLVDGEPCPVCGAHEHPSPAPLVHDPVSDDDIAAAEQSKEEAAREDRAAAAQLASARDAHAEAAAASGGATVEQARAAQSAASAALQESRAAVAERERIDTARAALDADIEALAMTRAALAAAGDIAREQRALAGQRLADAIATVEAARGAQETVAARVAQSQAVLDAAQRLVAALDEQAAMARAAADAREQLVRLIDASVFDAADDVRAALRERAVRQRLDETVVAWDQARASTKAALLDLELAMLPEEPVDLAGAVVERDATRERWVASVTAAAREAQTAERLQSLVTDAAEAHQLGRADAERFALIDGLATTLAGRGANSHRMALETFVLAAELEEIVAVANRRLDDMSSGRYQLRHTDALAARGASSGLGIEVVDAYTGRARPTPSLSGGESFLASLALALGLAEVVTARAGGLRLDTLFIDEGFGALDPETLDVAMQTLDALREGGRTVGLISHVESMKEQIPAQLRVEVAPEGWSTVSQA